MSDVLSIPLFQPAYTGKEEDYVRESFQKWNEHLHGSYFRTRCEGIIRESFLFQNFFLINSVRTAAELLIHPLITEPGKEIILSGYASPMLSDVILAAKGVPRYADVHPQTLNAEPEQIAALINEQTVAVIITHYAGITARIPEIEKIASKKKVFLIEDCTLAFGSYYNSTPLGSYGDAALFSFDEYHCVTAGSGGGITFTNKALAKAFEKNLPQLKHQLLPSSAAAILFAQLEMKDKIMQRRKQIWGKYYNEFLYLEHRLLVRLPSFPEESSGNGQLFFLLCNSEGERVALIKFLKGKNIEAASHYPLVKGAEELRGSREASKTVVLLPLNYDLNRTQHQFIIQSVIEFYTSIQ